jgi:hypothetical protein
MFRATRSANFTFSNNVERIITWDSEESDYGSVFDGTTFIAPQNGIYCVSAYLHISKVLGTPVYFYGKIKGSISQIVLTPMVNNTEGSMYLGAPQVYLTNGSAIYLSGEGQLSMTNKTEGNDSFFSAILLKALP